MQTIVYSKDNKQIIKDRGVYFVRVTDGDEVLESQDFNTLYRAMLHIGTEEIKSEILRDDNRLLSEFMGVKPYLNGRGMYEFMVAENCPVASESYDAIWEYIPMDYHCNWNSLMKVVQRCEAFDHTGHIMECLSTFDIELTHRACVRFVEQFI
jgi:hypothetical protein